MARWLCTRTASIVIDDEHAVFVDHRILTIPAETALARDDGFQGVYDMMQWFEKTHGTPLSGTLIEWSVIAPMPEGQEKP